MQEGVTEFQLSSSSRWTTREFIFWHTCSMPSTPPDEFLAHAIIVYLLEGGDAWDCSNYRSLTLLPVISKLFTELVWARIPHAGCRNDQKHAFQAGTGTLNPLQGLLVVVRQCTNANGATHAC